MTDAQRITLTGALRLLLQKAEYAFRAKLDLEQAQLEGNLGYPGTIEKRARTLAHADFMLDASIVQFVEVLERTLLPEKEVVQ